MKTKRFFTLMELMLAGSVMVVLLGSAAPHAGMLFSRDTTPVQRLADTLEQARNEAIQLHHTVTVSGREHSGQGNEWGHGWQVWVDRNDNGRRDPGELLRSVKVDSVIGEATFDSIGDRASVSFSPQGWVSHADDIDFCGGKGRGTRLSIGATGDIIFVSSLCS